MKNLTSGWIQEVSTTIKIPKWPCSNQQVNFIGKPMSSKPITWKQQPHKWGPSSPSAHWLSRSNVSVYYIPLQLAKLYLRFLPELSRQWYLTWLYNQRALNEQEWVAHLCIRWLSTTHSYFKLHRCVRTKLRQRVGHREPAAALPLMLFASPLQNNVDLSRFSSNVDGIMEDWRRSWEHRKLNVGHSFSFVLVVLAVWTKTVSCILALKGLW